MEYDRLDRPPRHKKKKRGFRRFMRGLGRYLASLPSKALILVGGLVIVGLIAVILLVVLLPKNTKVEPIEDQLAIENAATPTPTLPPISSPTPTPEPTATPGVTLEKPLELWSVADVVASIQERLVGLGYMEQPAEGYTTKYGPATKNGIRRFQLRNFENPDDWDGICGQKTYDLLMSDQAKAFFYTTGDTDDSLYDKINGVGRVTYLQNRLVILKYMKEAPTGYYGPTTVSAVQKFQQDNGLMADGKAGQSTLLLMFSDAAVDAETAKLRTPSPATSPGASTSPASVTAQPATSTSPNPSTSPSTAP